MQLRFVAAAAVLASTGCSATASQVTPEREAAAAHPLASGLTGINFDPRNPASQPYPSRDRLDDLGAGSVRFVFNVDGLGVDAALDEYKRIIDTDFAGLDVTLVLTNQSTDSVYPGSVDQAWAADLANVAGAAAAKLGPSVRYFEIGNEPDNAGPASWHLTPDELNRLLDAAYPAIHQQSDADGVERLVVLGGLAGDPNFAAGNPTGDTAALWDYVALLGRDESGNPRSISIDAIGLHPYNVTGDADEYLGNAEWTVTQIERAMPSGQQGLPVLFTEWGDQTGASIPETMDRMGTLLSNHPEVIQAHYFAWSAQNDTTHPWMGLYDLDGNQTDSYAELQAFFHR